MNDRYKPLSHETIFFHMLLCYSETRKNPLVQVDSAKVTYKKHCDRTNLGIIVRVLFMEIW